MKQAYVGWIVKTQLAPPTRTLKFSKFQSLSHLHQENLHQKKRTSGTKALQNPNLEEFFWENLHTAKSRPSSWNLHFDDLSCGIVIVINPDADWHVCSARQVPSLLKVRCGCGFLLVVFRKCWRLGFCMKHPNFVELLIKALEFFHPFR